MAGALLRLTIFRILSIRSLWSTFLSTRCCILSQMPERKVPDKTEHDLEFLPENVSGGAKPLFVIPPGWVGGKCPPRSSHSGLNGEITRENLMNGPGHAPRVQHSVLLPSLSLRPSLPLPDLFVHYQLNCVPLIKKNKSFRCRFGPGRAW